ncbi:MAG TPA: neutral/alkaline non-lysosomal ceramidase N-terminal domain-containing protein [Verrucomicrobiae bacterium]|nr:neutral/alkaline non-lysosomal ceramidase N-terminal domain-containing protein [Verrucomicrobiae bacterium]
MLSPRHRAFAILLLAVAPGLSAATEGVFEVGVARIDVTPEYPIRLSGYAVRKTESEGVEQQLWAKALAVGSDQEGPAILITVDNCGVCANVIDAVAARLKARAGVARERIAVCSSHTHSAPCTVGFAPNIFAMPIPGEQQATIERYTRELTDKLERAALSALARRRPARLTWNQGKTTFARNRRTDGGPVDHALPMLAVKDPDGSLRAVLANYACHCTTLGGNFNKHCGDWAGYAQEEIERNHPGAVALITIGCGADANPHPREGTNVLALAKQHGAELATEVKRMLDGALIPLPLKLECRAKQIELPFDTLPTREQWEERAKQGNIVGYHAKRYLERLDRGEKLPTTLPYFVQTWNFGDQLAMVFLPGEVVVDYSLRLKREFDGNRLWVHAYANDVPCYIPSRRILQEGGYEAETSLWYYDRPARLAPAVEDLIHSTVAELMPASFRAGPKNAELPPPKSPDEALAAFRMKPGFRTELVAAEPLIVDPAAIDWGADGKLWVCEMHDYPAGLDGNWKPGGRVKFLKDTNGDGRYDNSTLFLDNLPFPTGVTAWNKGVLVCAAPDIIYAEDTNGDGRADRVEKLFTGFATDNYQARVNSLSLGLDNWIYGANGLIGGKIRGSAVGKEINISGRDFRMRPDTGEFEPASGITQQGRVRDDWENWFGCDNSTLLWHYPLPEHYVRRNPHVSAPEPRVFVPADADSNRLFPTSRTLERFNDPGHANRTTSACGLGIYRDALLGEEFYGNAFLCEPVHNLVHRLELKPDGVTFKAHRTPDERQSEFLSSTDNWFRPVQARTGPDGALYVVDMYRFVIEHPRWISPERLAKLDVRAGADKGRIYRVVPVGAKLRPIRDLTSLSTIELAGALNSSNGTERDRVHLELLRRKDTAAVAPLVELFQQSERPAARLQALCVLDGLNALTPDLLENAIGDGHPAVRRHAVRLSEPFLSVESAGSGSHSPSHLRLLQLVNDADLTVRYQLALTLGEWNDSRAGQALGELARSGANNKWLRAAVLSSAGRFPAEILKSALTLAVQKAGRAEMIDQLIATAASSGNKSVLHDILGVVAPVNPEVLEPWRLSALCSLLDALDRKGSTLAAIAASAPEPARNAVERIEKSFDTAFSVVKQASADEATREAAIRFVGRSDTERTVSWLASWLRPNVPARLQQAAVEALAHTGSPRAGDLLLQEWQRHPPTLRGLIVSTLLSRVEWTNALLDRLEKDAVAPSEISPANRQRLLQHKNAGIKHRSETLFAANRTDRAAVLAKYGNVARLTGVVARGAEVFEKNCAQCHAFAGQGHAVGPDLSAFRTKGVEDFLVAILDPAVAIEPRFINYQIEMRDGRSLSGVITAETATSLTLVQGGGVEEQIIRGDIVEIRASNLSLMPEGLEQGISAQQMADLIAYAKQDVATR